MENKDFQSPPSSTPLVLQQHTWILNTSVAQQIDLDRLISPGEILLQALARESGPEIPQEKWEFCHWGPSNTIYAQFKLITFEDSKLQTEHYLTALNVCFCVCSDGLILGFVDSVLPSKFVKCQVSTKVIWSTALGNVVMGLHSEC